MRTVKDHLASWRHSADTATIERRSKVIDGRIHDARRAEKRRMKPAQGKEIAAVIGVLRTNTGGRLACAGTLHSHATLRQAIARRLPPFYPRANLNNRHSSHSRRKMVCIARQGDLQGNPTLERVEGQFNEYRSGSGTEPSAGSADAPRHFGAAFDAGWRRSRRERAARERAPHDRRRRVQRRHQHPDAVGLPLYVAGVRPGDSEPQPRDPVRPVPDGADRLPGAGIFRRDAVADALPDRNAVRWRAAGIDPFGARHPAAARGEAGPDAAAAARSRPGAHLHVGHGADGVPRHAVDSDLSDRAVSVPPADRLHGAARHRGDHCHDIGDRADLARRDQGGDRT